MVTLLLGTYGHGKSTYILDKIKEDYKNRVHSFLIVPEQQNLISERELTRSLPPSAQLYTEATNLTRLANSVFRKTGGIKYNYVTSGGKNLIMYRALCEVRDSLKQYIIPKGREKSCVQLFLQAIGELRAYGVEIEKLENSLGELESEDLKARIGDMLTVWSCYHKMLREMYDDPYDDLLMLEKKLGECEYFKDCNVYIDSFYGFTKSQLGVIERIIEGAKNVTIALDCPVDADEDTMQYVKIAGTKAKILSMCKHLKKEYSIVPFDDDYKHTSKEIQYVCDGLWNFDTAPIEACGDITLALADDEFQECEYVCSRIRELVNSGSRYGDIAIIARNTDTYQGIIDYCLDKFDIPYYLSAPSRLTSKPVIKMVFSALNALAGMKGEDIISYAKCGYTDLSPSSICLLESYIYKWSIYGKKFKNDDYWTANPDGYVQNPTVTQLRELAIIQDARANILKKLSILEKPFTNGGTVKDCAMGLYEFLEAHKIRNKLNSEIKKEDSCAAQELSQVWGALVFAIDLVVDICGDTSCDIESFTTLLSYAMMDAKIGTIPTGQDVVSVADASLVRAKNIRHVFVLGANEGSFPSVVNDISFFTDRDKIELETVQIDLSAKTDERGDDELLFFKNSIAVASSSATVTALKTNINGSKKEESIGFSRLRTILSGIKAVDISSLDTLDKIYTSKMAKELLSVADLELKQAILESTDDAPTLKPCFVNENDEISPDVASKIFGKTLYLSKSKLEKFAKCRFDYYCSYVLGLRDNEKISFTHNDIGTLVHSVFEHFLKLDTAERKDYTDDEILEIVTRLTDEYTAGLCGVRGLTNKMKHFFGRLKGTICVFVKALLEEMRHSKFTPEFFEISINGNGCSAPLPLEFSINNESSVIMTGIADRIDVCRTNDTTYLKIFDYKTGNYSFKLSGLDKGLDLQMLIYLMALCNMDDSEFKKSLLKWTEKIEPYGIVYLTYKINKTDADKEIDLSSIQAIQNEELAIRSKISRSGLALDGDELKSDDVQYDLNKGSYVSKDELDGIFELVKASIMSIGIEMLKGGAQAQPLKSENPCRYCKNGAICRRRVTE